MTPPRCYILMHSYGGGAEQVTLTLTRLLNSECLRAHIGCTRHIPALAAQATPKTPVHMPSHTGALTALGHLLRLRRQCLDSDVVLGSLELQSIFWAALLAPDRAIAWLHKDVEGYLQRRGRFYAFVYRTVLGWALRRCRRVVCVSQGVRDSTARLWPLLKPRLHVLWNPVDIARIRERALRPLPRSLHPLFTRPVILGVGRLEPQKAFHRLLRAHHLLVRRGLRHAVCIVGEGSERPRLEAEIRRLELENTVRLAGFTDPFPLMARSALLAVSSAFEGLSLVIIEALALDLPVVSVDCPSGPREVLRDGRYGTLVPLPVDDDDVQGLADALQAALARTSKKSDPDAREACRRRAEDFAPAATLDAWERLLREVALERTNRRTP